MRQTLFIAVVATLLIAAVVEVVAAGVKTVTTRSHFYSAPAGGIGVAVPASMKTFPTPAAVSTSSYIPVLAVVAS
jgi:hypothetical protein